MGGTHADNVNNSVPGKYVRPGDLGNHGAIELADEDSGRVVDDGHGLSSGGREGEAVGQSRRVKLRGKVDVNMLSLSTVRDQDNLQLVRRRYGWKEPS